MDTNTDYGTSEYCTCGKYFYEDHACPYDEEMSSDDEDFDSDNERSCSCCPYCTHQCSMDI